jgi:hypothetical protein
MIKKLPIYDMDKIVQGGISDAAGLQELRKRTDGLDLVTEFLSRTQKFFAEADRRWTELCGDNELELTEWASRMRLVRDKIDEISRHLAVKETHLFKWDTVLSCMGFLNAFRVAVGQVLDFNKPVAQDQQSEPAATACQAS